METLTVDVKTYPDLPIRSYSIAVNSGHRLSENDDTFTFRRTKSADENDVITFEEAIDSGEAYNKVGEAGAQIIQIIGLDPLAVNLVECVFVGSWRLNVLFTDTPSEKIDELVSHAIGNILRVETELRMV